MPKPPRNIDPFLPDGAVYNISINERMRRLLHAAVCEMVDNHVNDQDAEGEAALAEQVADDEVLVSLEELLDLDTAATEALVPGGVINSFVL